MLKKSLISIIILLSLPVAASAAQKFVCNVTHSTENESGVVQSEQSADSVLVDDGNTFTITPEGMGEKTSPALKTIKTADGGKIMTAKALDGMMYAKFSDSYVMRNSKEGYIYTNCKASQ